MKNIMGRLGQIVLLLVAMNCFNPLSHAADPSPDCAHNFDVDTFPGLPRAQQIPVLLNHARELTTKDPQDMTVTPEAVEIAVYLQSANYPAQTASRHADDLLFSALSMTILEKKSGRRYDQSRDRDELQSLEIGLASVRRDFERRRFFASPALERTKTIIASLEKAKLRVETKLAQTRDNPAAHKLAAEFLDAQANLILAEERGDKSAANALRLQTIPALLQAGADVRFYDPTLIDGTLRARDVLRYLKMQLRLPNSIGNPLGDYLEQLRIKALAATTEPLNLADSFRVAQRLLDDSVETIAGRLEKLKLVCDRDVSEAIVAQQDRNPVTARGLGRSIEQNLSELLRQYSAARGGPIEAELLTIKTERDARGLPHKLVLSVDDHILAEHLLRSPPSP